MKPELLVWARDSLELSREEAAVRSGISTEKLTAWEKGESRPSLSQLRDLAAAYRRPLAAFFLPSPPEEPDVSEDFRRLPKGMREADPSAVKLEIRRALLRREVALDLADFLREPIPNFVQGSRLRDDPERSSASARTALGINDEDQFRWRSEAVALETWRACVEQSGVLVFQTSAVSVEVMRGFSIPEHVLPIIVLNSKDSLTGREFTLLHEFGHLMLNAGARRDIGYNKETEVWCNRFAAAALVPSEAFEREPAVRMISGDTWSDEQLRRLARRYRVSREVILRRLETLGRISRGFYRAQRARLIEEAKRLPPSAGGRSTPAEKAVKRHGGLYTHLVLEAYHGDHITAGDVSDYLGVRLKHLREIELAVA